MIQAMIAKKIIESVFKKIETKHKLKKLKQYVEQDNELDIQMKQVHKILNKYGKVLEELEKDMAILKSDSHPPIFSNKDYTDILKRLDKLEKRSK